MVKVSGQAPATRFYCLRLGNFISHGLASIRKLYPVPQAAAVALALGPLAASAGVSFDMQATANSFQSENQQIGFVHTVTNQGSNVLYGLTVNTLSPSSQVCHINSLWPGATATCNSVYFTNQQNVSAGNVSVSSRVTGSGISAQSASATVPYGGGGNTQTQSFNAGSGGDLDLQASGQVVVGSDGAASAGDRVALTFNLRNASSRSLSGVRIVADRFGYQCNVGGLSPGTETSCSGSYYLKGSDLGATLQSTVSVNSDQGLTSSTTINVPNSGGSSSSGSSQGNQGQNNQAVTANSGGFNVNVGADVLAGYDGAVNAGDKLLISVDLSNDTNNTYLTGVSASDDSLGFKCDIGSLYSGSSTNCSAAYTLKTRDVSAGSVTINITATSNETSPVSKSKSINLPASSNASNSTGSSSSGSSGDTASGGSSGSSGSTGASGAVAAGPQSVSECSASAATGQNRRVITTNDDIATVVNGAPAGTEFLIKPGTHYTSRITPKHDQKFICESGAVISGATRLTGTWYQEGSLWYLDNVPSAQYGNGAMRSGRSINKIRNDLFVDDQLLLRVDSKSKVNATAKYFGGELIYTGTFYQTGNRVYAAINPNGRRVEYSMREWAFYSPKYYGDRVTVENCIVEKWASNDIGAAISIKETKDWTLRNVTARFNHTGGLQVGSNTKVYCGKYNKNGQIGITGSYYRNSSSGEVYSFSDNVLVNGAEVAHNNYAGYDSDWHASGIKFFETENMTVINSNIHHNFGVGVWADFDAYNVKINNNNIHNNASRGILLEAVFNGEVKNNKITCNSRLASYSGDYIWFWGAQLMLKNSPNFDVSFNDIELRYGQPWGLLDNQYRGHSSRYGARRSTSVQVHDNRIVFAKVGPPSTDSGNYFHQRVGIESDQGAKNSGLNVVAGDANNSVYSNTYVMADTNATHWRIDGTSYASGNIPGSWESSSSFQTSSGLGNVCN